MIADLYNFNQVVHPSLQKRSQFQIQHTSSTHYSKMFFFSITWMGSDKISISSYGKDTMGCVYLVNSEISLINIYIPFILK